MFVYDPELGQKPVPNQKTLRTLSEDPPYVATNDSEGLRITQRPAPGSPRKRILMLGDSFTYGTGVNDAETFSSLLARRAIVYNAGNPGVGTDYALKFLQVRAKDYSPQVVIVNFFPNDFADNEGGRYFKATGSKLEPVDIASTFDFYRRKQRLAESELYQWLASNSHLLSFARRAAAWISTSGTLGNLLMFLRNRPDNTGLERGFAVGSSISSTTAYFRGIKAEAHKLKASLVVTYIPSIVDIRHYRETSSFSKDERAFRQIMKELALPYLSFTETIAKSDEPLEKLYLNEGHWTPTSHALAAQALMKWLRY